MADAIVQTIKIEVDGAEEAAAEIKKVGQATEEVQQTAAKTAGGTQELGRGLDQVSEKSGVSQRQLRALGRVMKDLGGGELASTGIGFARFAMILGPIGASLFALGAALTFVKNKMKEAEEAAKAVTTTFANIAKTSAEMKAQDDAAFWGTTADALKKAANDASQVADQLRNIASGAKEAISPLTSAETETKAFITVLERAGIAVGDVMADTQKLGEASNKAAMEAAKIYEKMSPIEKLNFEKVLKGLGFTEDQIKSIEKGSEALRKAQERAAKFALPPEAAAKVQEMRDAFSSLGDTLSRIGDDIVILFGLKLKTIFIDLPKFIGEVFSEVPNIVMGAMAGLGQVLHDVIDPAIAGAKQLIADWVTTPVANAWGWVKDAWGGIGTWLSTKLDEATALITAWVTTPVANAWGWVKDAWGGIGTWLSTKLDEATALITAWVTTPIANAWAWIKEKWNANVPSWAQIGGGSAAPAAAPQGMAGGGLLGGRGTGTSDSNLAWVSRGEHIMPARAVRQPGVLAFLEALRRSGGNLRDVFDGMGRFALGGMVRAPVAFGNPAFAGGGMNAVTINFPGLPEITGLRASSAVVDELRKAAALAQVRSGGRKPSRYS